MQNSSQNVLYWKPIITLPCFDLQISSAFFPAVENQVLIWKQQTTKGLTLETWSRLSNTDSLSSVNISANLLTVWSLSVPSSWNLCRTSKSLKCSDNRSNKVTGWLSAWPLTLECPSVCCEIKQWVEVWDHFGLLHKLRCALYKCVKDINADDR